MASNYGRHLKELVFTFNTCSWCHGISSILIRIYLPVFSHVFGPFFLGIPSIQFSVIGPLLNPRFLGVDLYILY